MKHYLLDTSALLTLRDEEEGVIRASNEELESIDGIGKGIARKIRWAVGEHGKPYGDWW